MGVSSQRALGFDGDAASDRRLLADEVEEVAQGAVHAVLEAPAQAGVEQRVQAAVEVGQTQGQDLGDVDRRGVGGPTWGHQLEEVHDVQREEAEKEARHHGNDDPECFLGAMAVRRGARLGPLVHHPVADHDHQEGEEESQQKAGGGDGPPAQHRVDGHTLPLVLPGFNFLGEDELGDASEQSQDPDGEAAPGSQPGPAVVLAPDGFADHQPAVDADQNQLQDAAVHHQVEQAFHQRARQGAKVPLVVMGQRHHEQREGEAAQEVRQGQVQEPHRGHVPGHAEARHPDHHRVPGDTQQHHQGVEAEGHDLDGLDLRGQSLGQLRNDVVTRILQEAEVEVVHG